MSPFRPDGSPPAPPPFADGADRVEFVDSSGSQAAPRGLPAPSTAEASVYPSNVGLPEPAAAAAPPVVPVPPGPAPLPRAYPGPVPPGPYQGPVPPGWGAWSPSPPYYPPAPATPGAPPGVAPYGATAYAPAPFVLPPNHDSKAVASLILGLSSLVCLGALTGLPAIILGAVARRDIERSQGRTTGAGIAAGGIMTGLFGTGLSVVLAVCVIAGVLDASQASGIAPTEGPVPIAAGTRSYGSLDVVDLDEEQPLAEQLEEIVKNATGKGKTLVLQTYVRTSRECAEVASALPDQRMQRALANVTLVRVDVDVFESELLTMRVDTDSVPWFYKLDRSGRVIDAINADEWDENTATNMAPILGEFARGTLSSRRNPSPLGTEL